VRTNDDIDVRLAFALALANFAALCVSFASTNSSRYLGC
jgi:hypothetical protein